MKRDLAWWLRIAVPAVAVAGLGIVIAGSGASGGPSGSDGYRTSQTSTGIRLVSYDGCAGALTELRRAAFPLVGPYGFGGNVFAAEDSAGGSPPIGPRAGVPEQNSTSEGGAAAPAERKAAAGPAEAAGPRQPPTNTHP